MKNTAKALIVDGNSIINRAFYGIKNMATNQGFPTGAIYGFLNILHSVTDELKPQYIVVCFDLKGPTFRHEQYDGYKATRKKMPEDLALQLPELKKILTAMNISIEELEGFEADDLLGAISKEFKSNDVYSYLLTGDKDSLQLVDDMTFVYYHGTKNRLIYDDEAVFEDLGVYPNQVVDLKALMGDSSDNIPGVAGIGAVSAKKLIGEFHDLKNLLEHTDDIKAKRMRELIKAGVEQALLSKQLATIVRDLPVEIDISEYLYGAPNYDELIELYKKFSLNKFLSQLIKKKNDEKFTKKDEGRGDSSNKSEDLGEIKKEQPNLFDMQLVANWDGHSNDSKDEKNEGESSDFKYINSMSLAENIELSSEDEILKFIDDIKANQKLFITQMVDIENIFDAKLPFLGLMKENGDRIFVSEKADEILRRLSDKKVSFVGHNLKSLLLYLKNLEISLDILFDAEIAMYLCEANKNSFELHDLSIYLGSDLYMEQLSEIIGKGKSQIKYSQVDDKVAIRFMNKSLEVIADSYHVLNQKLEHLQMEHLYKEVELPLVYVLCELQYNGISVDMNVLDELDQLTSDLIKELETQIYDLAQEEFNISSPKQLSVILFEKLGLIPPKKNKTGYSTSHEVLVKLIAEHEIIDKIIEYRRYTKLKSTYIEGLRAVINPFTNKIHSSFNQTVAATGRLSSTEPNLQNIPIRLEIGREFRKAFVASENYVLVDADYSQIELRVLAHMSEDERLKEAYEKNIDIHTMTASQVFDVPIDEVDSDLRSRAKAVNFGIV